MSAINIINKLPDDVTKYMLSFSTPTDLNKNIDKTSKSLHTLSNDPLFWNMTARNLGVRVEPEQSAKNAVLAQGIRYKELNHVFLTTIQYLRGQAQNHPNVFQEPLREVPTASDSFEQHKKILQWCSEDILENAKHYGEDTLTAKTSSALSFIQLFNTCPALLESAHHITPPPREIYDPRLLEIFSKANPEVEPKDIHFLNV